MTKFEKKFLKAMDVVWDLENCWRNNNGICGYVFKHEMPYKHTTASIIVSLETCLVHAGQILGLTCRFRVDASSADWSVTILPKNGHARLMLQRYEELYTERELSDD